MMWSGGISFGGVISFIFADLLILPILNIYRTYYGLKMTAVITGVFYLAAFPLLAPLLLWRFLRTGGRQMLAMMGGSPTSDHRTRPPAVGRMTGPGFYIVSSWFLATTAASGREGGGMPDQPGRSSKGVHHDGLE